MLAGIPLCWFQIKEQESSAQFTCLFQIKDRSTGSVLTCLVQIKGRWVGRWAGILTYYRNLFSVGDSIVSAFRGELTSVEHSVNMCPMFASNEGEEF